MSWSIQAAGHVAHDDIKAAADLERTLYGHLASLLGDSRWGLSASQFTGQFAAGSPGFPEPEPEPAPVPLSLEEQNAALQDEINQLKLALAGQDNPPQNPEGEFV